MGGFVALTNLTGGVLQVSAQAIDSTGNLLPAQTFGVLAHSIQMLHLNALTAGLADSENQAGGLRLKYNGEMGALAVSGGLVNERRGYSAGIPFWYHDPDSSAPAAITYASAGVMIGQPDAMMGFPRSTAFTPYTVLRNTTAQSLPVKMTMNYMAEPKPISLSLPVAPLNPYETRKLDLPTMLGALGLTNFQGDANLLFSFTGHAGDLMLATGSVDQTENYVFVVEPQGVGKSFGKAGHYWISANDFDTMYSLFNPTDRAQDFIATIYYSDGSGSYQMPVHLEAHASTMIDMMMLIGEKRPDVHGNVIPASVQQGSMVIENPKGKDQWMTLVVSGGVYNPRRGTCGVNCIYCYGYCNTVIILNPFAVAVQATTNLYAQATYSDGTVQDFTTSSSWTSDNTPVATVGSSTGVVTGGSVGSANIIAAFPTLVAAAGQVCAAYEPFCPTFTATPSSGGSVLSVSESPTQIAMSTGDTNNQITVSVNPGTVTATTSFAGTSPPSINPNSSCAATLSIPGQTGQGSLASTVTASPANCSGIFNVTATANGVSSSNNTTVEIPPQVLIQMMYGEAKGAGSNAQLAVGVAARNRFNDTTYFNGDTNYQNTIVSSQFNGIDITITTGVTPELGNAIGVFSRSTNDFITPTGKSSSQCFFTPTATQWTQINAAVQSGTTNEGQVPNATGCYSLSPYQQQIRVVTYVGTNSSGVPWFVFQGPRSSSSDPVAVQF